MQTVSPPMFLCQPKLFNEDWHTIHSRTWHDIKDELVYYKPVLMNSAGGNVAHKGLVGNKPPVEQLPDKAQDTTTTNQLPANTQGNIYNIDIGRTHNILYIFLFTEIHDAVPTVTKEKIEAKCPSCNEKIDPCTNLQLTGGLCDNCYHINTTCNKCSMQLTPTDTHWYGEKGWHKDCLPVRYCPKYKCNQELHV